MVTRHKVAVCVYLILQRDNKVLLGLRQNTGFADGKWGLISGHVESQESARSALSREVAEEIGITVKVEDLCIVHVMHRRSDRENIDIFMTCRSYQGEIHNQEPHKCGKLAFFSQDQLPEFVIDYIAHALKNIKNGITYSEYGWDHAS
ncbi:MAG TPA: NUDIX domain-containing protein [Candidatus Nitrosotenuis sp.]|jgi:ADP-ribose pyrophosphatase YjhB (NUDIX family)|nr:NUDIX domain-containing protein [Candidatus Nitrosotenuis sp.]